jgi:hypothetical protein
MEGTGMQNKSAIGKLKVKYHLGELKMEGRTILKWIFEGIRCEGSCEYGNEPSSSSSGNFMTV